MKIILLISLSFLWAQDFEYIGINKCKTCHKSEKKGAQFKKWEAGPHAQAFETLKSEESIAIAKKAGLTKAPWEADQCLKCHSTGYGMGGYEVKDAAFWEEKTEKGKSTKAVKRMGGLQTVGCESCHGPGSLYKKKKVMTAVYKGETDAVSVGLWRIDEGTCKQCHNESSPTYKPFDYDKRYKEILHPYPDDME